MFQKILFWLTAPIKALGVSAINRGREIIGKSKFEKKTASTPGSWDEFKGRIEDEFLECKEELARQCYPWSETVHFLVPRRHEIENVARGPLFPDHQALRTGSAIWAAPEHQELINGLEYFFDQSGMFSRGMACFKPLNLTTQPTVPAMGIGLAQALLTAAKAQGPLIKLPPKATQRFIYSVNQLMDSDFTMGDVSVKPRVEATSFDAIFSCAMLSVAGKLTDNSKYYERHDQVWAQYRLLLKAPLTYFSSRNYFLDHVSMVGLWCVLVSNIVNKKQKADFKAAMRSIWKLSEHFGNPYFAALMDEAGALTDTERLTVLTTHQNTSPLTAMKLKSTTATNLIPVNWDQMSDSEFIFDQVPVTGQPLAVQPGGEESSTSLVPLNGVVLGRSMLILAKGL